MLAKKLTLLGRIALRLCLSESDRGGHEGQESRRVAHFEGKF